MPDYSKSHRVSGRYLTPFYRFALGLVIILVLSACDKLRTPLPGAATETQAAILSQTASPSPIGTQDIAASTSTSLPIIPPTPNEQTPSPLGVTTDMLRGVQVNLWYPWKGPSGAILQSILDDFNRTNQWGIVIQSSAYEDFGSLDDAVERAMTSDALPDVLLDYGYQAQHWDESGVLADLTPYVNDPVWGLTKAEQADFYPGFWAEDLVTTDNPNQARRLGIPYYRSAYLLFYNHRWAKELGYSSAPSTPADFKAQACAAAESMAGQGNKSDLGKGGWLITPQPGVFVGWIYAFGGRITNPEAAGYLFNTPEVSQALAYLKGMFDSGCAWTRIDVDEQSEFANRRALFLAGSIFDIPAQQEAFTHAGSSDDWVVIPFPSDHQPVVNAYGPSWTITQSNPAQQLADWLVVKWLVYPPNLAKWVMELQTYPARKSVLSYLSEAELASPQWAEALELLPDARSEPSLASWRVMRWSLNDASTQLFSQQFSANQIPTLLENLDQVASEIFLQVH